MKKSIIIIIIIFLIIFGGAAYFLIGKKPANNNSSNPSADQNSNAPGIKESLLGLLEKGTGIQCSVVDNGITYNVIAKGDKVRVEGLQIPDPKNPSSLEKGTMINDGNWAYVWNGKSGMKFNLKTAGQDTSPAANQEQQSTDWKGWAKEMEASGAKYDCSPKIASDADFTPPSDVVFQSLDEIMKNFNPTLNSSNVPAIPDPTLKKE